MSPLDIPWRSQLHHCCFNRCASTLILPICTCPKNSGTQWFLGALLWVAVPLHCAPHAVSKVHTYRAEWWCDPYVSRRYRRRRNIIRAERDLGLPILRMRAAQKHGAE